MKLTGLFLVLLAWPGALLANDGEQVPPDAPAKLSTHVSAMVRAALPGFKPVLETKPATPPEANPVVAHDSDVLELPKITVREKPPPKVEPLDLLVKSERKKKLAHDFRNSLTGLDRLLNGFSIPIFSPSMAERGRRYRQQQQLEELNRTASAIRQDDPKAAADLQKDAADARRALDQQNRPAGHK